MRSPFIQKATDFHLKELIAMMQEHAAFEGARFSLKEDEFYRKNFFQVPEKVNLYLIFVEGTVMGYFSYTIDFSTWDASCFLHLDCLYLKEGTRGKGIGRQIFAFLKQRAVESSCVNIQWQTPVSNKRAIDFYYRLGATSKTKERFVLSI